MKLKYVKMRHPDRNETADVADIEIAVWQAHGFEVIDGIQAQTETEAQTEAKPVRRGRPRKAD